MGLAETMEQSANPLGLQREQTPDEVITGTPVRQAGGASINSSVAGHDEIEEDIARTLGVQPGDVVNRFNELANAHEATANFDDAIEGRAYAVQQARQEMIANGAQPEAAEVIGGLADREWLTERERILTANKTGLTVEQVKSAKAFDERFGSSAIEFMNGGSNGHRNIEQQQAGQYVEMNRGGKELVVGDELTPTERGDFATAEKRETLALTAEVYTEMVGENHRGALKAATSKFAAGVRNGAGEVDLSQAYEVPAGLSKTEAQRVADGTHESVVSAMRPLFSDAEKMGTRVKVGNASVLQTQKIQEQAQRSQGFSA